MADPSDLSVGNKVKWGYANGDVYGRIANKSSSSELSSEAGGDSGGQTLEGEEGNPAFKIDNYDYDEDEEKWKPTGDKTVHRAENLTKLSSWPDNP